MKKVEDAYTIFAQYYDEIMAAVPYDEWLDYLKLLFEKFQIEPRRILDLACGTGNMTVRLAKEGYQLWGIDKSTDMLEIARNKARKADLDINFRQGDFRSFELEEPVDLVISLYDSINYLLKEEDLAVTFRQVYHHLVPDGYFIFDVNSIERLKDLDNEDTTAFEENNYFCFWKDSVEPEIPLWKVHLTFLIEQEGGNLIRHDEKHVERGYSVEVLQNLLIDAGFRVMEILDAYTLRQGTDYSERLYFIVQKSE